MFRAVHYAIVQANFPEFLTSLLPQLLAWLDNDEEDLLHFIRSAMYSYSELGPEEQKNVRDFLPALEGLAWKRSGWQMIFSLRFVMQSCPGCRDLAQPIC